MYVNKNYIVEHKQLWHSFKCVIEKIENKNHLIIPENQRVHNDDEFCPPDTLYKEMIKIMLISKFYYLNEQRILNQEVEKQKYESMRRRFIDNQQMRPMVENNSDKNESWYAWGPFHYLMSKQGILSDPVTTEHEVIIAAK